MEEIIAGLIVMLVTASFTAFVAGSKNYSKPIWFGLGAFFSFIALLAIVGASPKQTQQDD